MSCITPRPVDGLKLRPRKAFNRINTLDVNTSGGGVGGEESVHRVTRWRII